MDINTDIHSVIIKFLTIEDLKQIKTINKKFYEDITLNKIIIREMIINERNITRKNFLYSNLNKFIVDILLIKYKNIDTIYNKYQNIDNDYTKELHISIIDDIYGLITSNIYDPYPKYINNFIYIDTIFIIILNTNFSISHNIRLLDVLNKHLSICKDYPKILKFIYLSSKRISYSSEPIFTYNHYNNSYFLT